MLECPAGVLRRGACALAGVLTLGAAQALAQPAPAPPPQPTYGPPIAGLCLFAQNNALARSQIGVSANQQLVQFAQGVDAELKAQQSAIVGDDRALAKQKGAIAEAIYDQRVAQLKDRYADLGRTKQMREAQLLLTRQDAIAQVGRVLTPSLAEAITARRCSVVFEKGGTYGAADAMDITPAVIERMDARQSSIVLRLATPDAVRAAAAAAQPKPATP